MRLPSWLLALAAAPLLCSCEAAAPSCDDLQPGDVPPPSCAKAQACPATAACSSIDASTCGSPDTCMPLVHNADRPTKGFRMRKIEFIAPKRMTDPAFQTSIIDLDMELKQPVCGTPGRSGFNWLLDVDRDHGTLLTGSGPPPADMKAGFCFFDKGQGGSETGPVKAKVTFRGDTFDSEVFPRLDIPILSQGNVNDVVRVPMQSVRFSGVTLSESDDCIGRFQKTALADDCLPRDLSACAPWATAGAVAGFVTLEDADTVKIADLGQSLCAFLTGSVGPDGKCERTGSALKAKGDYCSTTGEPGGCEDSVWIAATFAASAVAVQTDGCGG